MTHAVAVLVVSLAPAIAFLVLIIALDRREPEPFALILATLGLGAASALPAMLVEALLAGVPPFARGGFAGAAAGAFLQVAPVEEAGKLAAVLALAWRRQAFNEENDGIVYAGAAAIGFAALENVLYVAGYGLGTGAARAFTAIPLHVFTAVLMGLQLGRARFAPTPAARRRRILAGFLLAWALHGAYDAFALSGSGAALLLLPLLAGLAAFGTLALRTGRRLSLARWGRAPVPVSAVASAEPPADAPVADTASAAAAPSPVARPRAAPRQRWMPVVSRLLLGASALFWVLLAAGLVNAAPGEDTAAGVLGGILLTVVPVSLGAVLEVAWARRRRGAVPGAASRA